MASNRHQGVALFDQRVGRGVKDHFSVRALDCDNDYIEFGTYAGVLQCDADER